MRHTAYTAIQCKFLKIRSNKLFENIVVAVIIFSALLIGAKTYSIPSYLQSTMLVLDYSITLFFLIEIVIRFLGEERKNRFLMNGWNLFDTTIVIVSLLPLNDSELAVIGRLIRIFRVLRMVSIIPELRMLINSLIKALPQLGYVMLLMFIIFYIYAAIGSTFFAKINSELWGDITISLLTLFRVMTFEDWTDVMYETMAVYSMSWLFYVSFIFFTAFAFLNMVIGIVVNVLEEERSKEKSQLAAKQEQLLIKELRSEIADIKNLLEKRVSDG